MSSTHAPWPPFTCARRCESQVFDLIKGMGIAQSDMNGNATALKGFAEKNPGATLQEICDKEVASTDMKKLLKGGSAVVALLWLQRAMKFITVRSPASITYVAACNELTWSCRHQVLLEQLDKNRSEKMSACVMAGYEASLKKYHGFAVKQVFNVAVKAAPYRENFMAQLAPTEDEAFAQIKEILASANAVLAVNDAYLKKIGAEEA